MSEWRGDEARAECRDLRVRVNELEAELETAKQSAAGWKALLLSKKERARNLEQQFAQARDHVIEQERGIVGRERRIAELEQELSTLREAALYLWVGYECTEAGFDEWLAARLKEQDNG